MYAARLSVSLAQLRCELCRRSLLSGSRRVRVECGELGGLTTSLEPPAIEADAPAFIGGKNKRVQVDAALLLTSGV